MTGTAEIGEVYVGVFPGNSLTGICQQARELFRAGSRVHLGPENQEWWTASVWVAVGTRPATR